MAARAHLLSPEHREFVVVRYLADTPPRDLVAELNAKFGVVVTPAQLRQFISRSGLAARRAELDRKTCALVSSAQTAGLAKAKAAGPAAVLAQWATRTVGVTEKAIAMAETAAKPRDLASAVGAMAQSVKTFRLLAGINDGTSGRVTNFNYNFASIVPERIAVDTPEGRTELTVTPAPGQAGAPVPVDIEEREDE